MANSTPTFQQKHQAAKSNRILVKKETVGGITTETFEGKDGRQWLFAYRNAHNVISSHLEAVKTTRLAESLTL